MWKRGISEEGFKRLANLSREESTAIVDTLVDQIADYLPPWFGGSGFGGILDNLRGGVLDEFYFGFIIGYCNERMKVEKDEDLPYTKEDYARIRQLVWGAMGDLGIEPTQGIDEYEYGYFLQPWE